jgi:hypothetical protein
MTEITESDHYPECAAVQKRPVDRGPCTCEAINAEAEAYYAEPPDMANRENGFIN